MPVLTEETDPSEPAFLVCFHTLQLLHDFGNILLAANNHQMFAALENIVSTRGQADPRVTFDTDNIDIIFYADIDFFDRLPNPF